MVQSKPAVLSSHGLLSFLAPFEGRPFLVAFSGGVDSTVLLHLLVDLRDQGFISDLRAVHVNHNLSANAEKWALHCEQLCQQWNVPLTIEWVDIDGVSGIEEQARTKRYKVFESLLPESGCLAMGHHQDDQAETVLFRMFRGSGLDGLAGIPAERSIGAGVLLRPLLEFSRPMIEVYAKQNDLEFIEDESNKDERFSRNYLRQSVIPLIENQWQGAASRIAAIAEEAAENKILLQSLVEEHYQVASLAPPSGLWGEFDLLDVTAMKTLSEPLAGRVLRYWLCKNNGSESRSAMPDRKHLEAVFSDLIWAKADAEPVVEIAGAEIRRFGNRLVLKKSRDVCLEAQEWHWQQNDCCCFSDRSSLMAVSGGNILLPDRVLSVRFRPQLKEGMKVKVSGRQGSKTVKRWLQEYQVPPWMRDKVPFLFCDDEMIAAADLWVCEGYFAQSDSGQSVIWGLGQNL